MLSLPVFYALELTADCNNACPGCGNVYDAGRGPAHLPASRWREILDRIAPHTSRFKLTGGEPTLHPEFEAIARAVADRDRPFSVFTNARWQDPDRLLAFLAGVPQCSGLLVSLHGATAGPHDAFTGVPGSFDETAANVRRAVAAGLPVSTSTVITGCNWRQVDDIVGLSHDLGARYAVFNRHLGHSLPGIAPSPEQLRRAVRAIEGARRAAPVRVRFGNCVPQCFVESSSTGCLAGIALATVDPWGNVRPCNHAPLICGNLLEESPEAIWRSEPVMRWRALLPAQCEDCGALARCHGGCRAVAMLLGLDKDPLIGQPFPRAEGAQIEIELFEAARPLARFEARSESFGYVLVGGNSVIPVTHDAKPLLDALDGRVTLQQVQESFGEEGLSFVGSLYQRGLVALLQDD
jgi:radical SAM protein with 4Fe4S-binding SPASM domain